jgi:hypothetical protein
MFPNLRVFNEGRQGFLFNLTNPYPLSSDRGKEWERGFNNAYFENLIEQKKQQL